MRMQGVTDEVETFEEDISKAESALRSIGVEVRKSPTEFKPVMDVLTELSGKFKTLTDVEKNYVTEAMAGKYRANILKATLQNFDMVGKQMEESINSAGSAMQENEIYMQSMEAKLKQLSATMTQFWVKTMDTDLMKGFVDSLKNLIEVFGSLPFIIAVVSSALLLFKGKVITTGIVAIWGYIAALTSLAATEGVVATATFALTGAFNTLKLAFLSNPIGIVAVALTALAGAFIFARAKTEEYRREQEQLRQQEVSNIQTTTQRLLKTKEEIQTTDGLISKYEELKKKTSLTEEEKQNLKNTQIELIKLYPRVKDGVDSVTGAYNVQIDAVKRLSAEQKKLVEEQAKINIAKSEALMSKYGTENTASKNKFEDATRYKSIAEQVLGDLKSGKKSGKQISEYLGSSITKEITGGLTGRLLEQDLVPIIEKRIQSYNDVIIKESDKQMEIMEAEKTLNSNKELLEKLRSGKLDGSTPSSTESSVPGYFPSSSSKPKSTPQGSAPISSPEKLLEWDRYYEQKQALDLVNVALERNNALQQAAKGQDRVNLLKEEVELLEDKKKRIHDLAQAERAERSGIVSVLGRSIKDGGFGISFTGSGDSLAMSNFSEIEKSMRDKVDSHRKDKDKTKYNELNEQYKEFKNLAEAFRRIQISVRKNSTEWWRVEADQAKNYNEQAKITFDDLSKSVNHYDESLKNTESQIKALGDDDIVRKVELLGKKIEVAGQMSEFWANEAQRFVEFPDVYEKINELAEKYRRTVVETTAEMKELREVTAPQKAKEAIESYIDFVKDKTDEHLKELKRTRDLEKQASEDKIKDYQNEIDKLEEKAKIEEEEIKRAKLIADLAKKQKELDEVKKERNVRIYRAGQGFVWEADPKKIKEVTEEVKKIQEDFDEFEKDNLLKRNKKYWEDKIRDEKTAQEKSEREYEDYVYKIQKSLEDLEKSTQSATENQITSWNALELKLKELGISAPKELEKIKKAIGEINSLGTGLNFDVSAPVKSVNTEFNKGTGTPIGNIASTGIPITNAAQLAKENLKASDDLVIEQMKKNSSAWASASPEQRTALANANLKLGASIGANRDSNGVWWKNGTRLYDKGGILNSGGMAVNLSGEPERILSPELTKSFDKFVEYLPNMMGIVNRAISTFSMPNVSVASGNSGGGDTIYDFHDFTIQSNDVRGFLEQIKRKVRSS